MNKQGRESARERAIKGIINIGLSCGQDLPRAEVEQIVDDLVLASKLPDMTAHEAAVADLRREQPSGTVDGPDPRD